jgi:subtilisin family serine protease
MPNPVDRKRLLEFANTLLYETPGGMRFTQDSPVLTNVWLAYALEPRSQQKLILTLARDKSAGKAAMELRGMLERLREREDAGKYKLPVALERKRARISYIPGQISAELYFDEMMRIALPLTPWWKNTYTSLRKLQRSPLGAPGGAADWLGFPMDSEPRIKDTADGLMLMRREILEEHGLEAQGRGPGISQARRKYLRQIPVDYLWLVRLAGLIGNAFLHDHGLLEEGAAGKDGKPSEIDELSLAMERDFMARKMDPRTGAPAVDSTETADPKKIKQHRGTISQVFSAIYQNWSDEKKQPSESFIWRVTKNRPVDLAVAKSALTVKADAARRLFSISCKDLTWAVIDSGIDGEHPAFRNTSAEHEHKKRKFDDDTSLSVGELDSRVVKTLDFTHIRDLLDYDVLCSTDDDGSAVSQDREELLKNLSGRLLKRFEFDRDDPELNTQAKVAKANKNAPKTARDGAIELLAHLRDRIKRQRDIDWEDLEPLIIDGNPAEPTNDHGTHVAGILGADWIEDIEAEQELPLAVRTRRMQGICPDINLIDVRVFREDGKTDEFELLAAVQFLRWMNSRAGYMVVHGANLSLSLVHEVRRFACGQTPICEECNEASALGMVIVAAAGNRGFEASDMDHLSMSDGFRDASITDPGNADGVITVGATHRKRPHEYGVSFFSSRGPTGDGRIKPDLVAPGEKITGPTPDGGSESKDGTSMAAPHVSGAAAMLMARHPELVGQSTRIKKILCETATDLHRERYYQGHGLLDILRALQSV